MTPPLRGRHFAADVAVAVAVSVSVSVALAIDFN